MFSSVSGKQKARKSSSTVLKISNAVLIPENGKVHFEFINNFYNIYKPIECARRSKRNRKSFPSCAPLNLSNKLSNLLNIFADFLMLFIKLVTERKLLLHRMETVLQIRTMNWRTTPTVASTKLNEGFLGAHSKKAEPSSVRSTSGNCSSGRLQLEAKLVAFPPS